MSVKVYQKGVPTKLSDEWESTHFDCKCLSQECTQTFVDESLVDGLDKLAIVYPIIKINSAFRCKDHNAKVGGSPNSQHLFGKAADIQSPFGSGKDLAVSVEVIPVFKNGGVGVAKHWIHVDTRGHRSRWTYPIIK